MLINLVGLGGVGSVIARQMGLHHNLHLVDFDVYESNNSHRQPLARIYPDAKKVAAHKNWLYNHNTTLEKPPTITISDEAITSEGRLPLSDLIICAVDNNKARNACRKIAINSATPLIIAANEQMDGEASMLLPAWIKTDLDPWMTWPQLYDERTKDDIPIPCTDPRIEETAPQTPVSNFMAASGAIWLAESFLARKSQVGLLDAIRFAFTQNTVKTKRPIDLITPEIWTKLQ